MFNLFKKKTLEKAPYIIVIKSDDMDQALLERFKKELAPAFPDKSVAVVCIGLNEDLYCVKG
jgi:hypothetical protein